MLSKKASILNAYTKDPGFVFLKPHRVKGVCVYVHKILHTYTSQH